MSMIRPKQIRLNAQHDLIVGGASPNFNGTVLSLGSNNQVLQVISGALQYGYFGRLRDGSGNLINDFTPATTPVNYLVFGNANTGSNPTLSVGGTDTNIGLTITTVGTGRVNLTNNLFPNSAIAAYSVLATQSTAGDLQAVTSPNNSGDHVLLFDDTNDVITWTPVASISGFNEIGVAAGTGGAFSGTQPLLSSTALSYTLQVSDGLRAVATNTAPMSIDLRLAFDALTQETNLSNVSFANDYIAYYSTANTAHRRITINQLRELISEVLYDEVVVTSGGPNLTLTGFFSQAPINVSSVTVFVNGLALRQSGWTVTGTDLTFVDSVNGYQIDTGDVVTARYES